MISLIYIIAGLIVIVSVVSASFLGATLAINKKKFIIRADKDNNELILEPINNIQKAEFLEEADQEQLEEMELSPGWRNFFKNFVKPRK